MTRVIQGIAIEPNSKSFGISGVERLWKEEHLRPAAPTLAGCEVTKGLERASDEVVGVVRYSEYIENRGVRYETVIDDETAIDMIERGIVSLAPRMKFNPANTDTVGPCVCTDIEFTGLFLTTEPCDNVPELGRPGIDRM